MSTEHHADNHADGRPGDRPAESRSAENRSAENRSAQDHSTQSFSGEHRSGNDPRKTRPRPLTGPIVWGALFLVACAYFVQRALAPGVVDAAGWITATVIGLGVLLLVVGVAVVIRNRREP